MTISITNSNTNTANIILQLKLYYKVL